jgi:hypothetical protein
MIHMQTKQNSRQAIQMMLKVFYKLNTFGKNEMVTTLLHYPEYYQEFVETMNKETYEKYMVRA